MYNGIINIYKEKGFTSHDVVAKMRGICKQKKIGHTGTLDPDAVGVLPVCLGNGTKLCDMLTDKDKVYEAELLLGITTDTQDVTGEVLVQRDVTSSESQVREAIESFVGDYMQVPPMYSALKVDGKKLYELARAGKEVERAARPVKIYGIDIISIELPVIKMTVSCSKGTYIRTLCHDIGEKLGCGGTMKSLKRTQVGIFKLEDSITLAQLEMLRDENRITDKLCAVDSLFMECPALHAKEEVIRLLDNGNSIYPNQTQEGKKYPEGEWVRVYGGEKFYGIFAYEEKTHRYKPVKMFL